MFLIFAAVAFLLFLMAVSQSSLKEFFLCFIHTVWNIRLFFFRKLSSQNRRMVWWFLATLRRNGADYVVFCFPALHLWNRLEQRTVGHCVMI